ncbi:hypothetical protein B0A49_03044 [Cryomyces minteri]|uniref:HMG box domain-containing protein n=1 Tax=Cryomyces minteri TaxID=331657 RepID=A0A4U0XIR3_9PEZI|nr:hypothetical protein B0A49_03044 [Cryomyces minteri]
MQHQQGIEVVWLAAIAQLTRGQSEIVLSLDMMGPVGADGIAAIRDRYSALLKAPVNVVYESSAIRFIGPSMTDLAGIVLQGSPSAISDAGFASLSVSIERSSSSKPAKKAIAKIPRPPNAFIMYRQHHHPLVKAAFPNIHNNQISVILGNQWKNEKQEVKHEYKKKAQQVKQKHFEDHPDYQYQPRKPSEKKKRMTKRKAAALADATSAFASTSATSSLAVVPASATSTTTEEQDVSEILPEFQISEDGMWLTHDMSLTDDASFLEMIQNYNAAHPALPAAAPNYAAAHSTKFTVEAGADHVYHQHLINYDNLTKRAEAQHAQLAKEYADDQWYSMSSNVSGATSNNMNESGGLSTTLGSFDMRYEAFIEMAANAENDRMDGLMYEARQGEFNEQLGIDNSKSSNLVGSIEGSSPRPCSPLDDSFHTLFTAHK